MSINKKTSILNLPSRLKIIISWALTNSDGFIRIIKVNSTDILITSKYPVIYCDGVKSR